MTLFRLPKPAVVLKIVLRITGQDFTQSLQGIRYRNFGSLAVSFVPVNLQSGTLFKRLSKASEISAATKLRYCTAVAATPANMSVQNKKTVSISVVNQVDDAAFDGVVLITDHQDNTLDNEFSPLAAVVADAAKVNSKFGDETSVLHCSSLPSRRLIVSPTGPLNRDYDDARRIYDAAAVGIAKAIKAGCTKPLLALGPLRSLPKDEAWAQPPNLQLTSLLGALQALYVPLEVREFASARGDQTRAKESKAQLLGFLHSGLYDCDYDKVAYVAWCLEEGRRVTRDIGGSDPERMTAPRIVDYLRAELDGSSGIRMTAEPVDPAKYPLAAAVDRATTDVARHRGQIIHLEYSKPEESLVDSTLLFVGKGITYDSGGADIKTGGLMVGMHRDKCGAAAVAGLFKVLQLLKPAGIKVVAGLACVRNSVGSNCYVSDEVVTSRAGVRVRVTNTDAEGRMVMADLLCEMKEKALSEVNPQIFTIATLTGHVVATYGENYTCVMTNGPGRKLSLDANLQKSGSLLGDMMEISTIRREDFEAHKAMEEYAELRNTARPPGGKRVRGHQSPPAFMMIAAGLDKHLIDSEKPLPYVHLDIAGSQGPYPGIPTGAPLLALVAQYILPRC